MLRKTIAAGVLLVASMASGCAALNDAAETVSGREIGVLDASALQGADIDVLAYASAGAWRAVQMEGARLAQSPETPAQLKAAIGRADRIGTPLMIELTVLAETYGGLKSIGRSAGEREAVRVEIESLMPQAQANLRAFAVIVSGASENLGEGR